MVELRVSDRELMTSDLFPKMAMRCCIFGKNKVSLEAIRSLLVANTKYPLRIHNLFDEAYVRHFAPSDRIYSNCLFLDMFKVLLIYEVRF